MGRGVVPSPTAHEIDGCPECGLFWLDMGELPPALGPAPREGESPHGWWLRELDALVHGMQPY